MFDSRFLKLSPLKVFCPICGEWHSWRGKTLGEYTSKNQSYKYSCNNINIRFCFLEDSIYISSDNFCDPVYSCLEDKIPFKSFTFKNKSIVQIPVKVFTKEVINSSYCKGRECDNFEHCYLPYIGDEEGCEKYVKQYFVLKFALKFDVGQITELAEENKAKSDLPKRTKTIFIERPDSTLNQEIEIPIKIEKNVQDGDSSTIGTKDDKQPFETSTPQITDSQDETEKKNSSSFSFLQYMILLHLLSNKKNSTYCTECGTAIIENSKFCHNCGKKI